MRAVVGQRERITRRDVDIACIHTVGRHVDRRRVIERDRAGAVDDDAPGVAAGEIAGSGDRCAAEDVDRADVEPNIAALPRLRRASRAPNSPVNSC